MLDILEARRTQLDDMHRILIQSIETPEDDDIYTILDRTSIQHPVPAVVLSVIESQPIPFVARVYLTHVFKQELFSRTIPDYTPPSLQQQLSTILNIDLLPLSDKQATFLYNQLTNTYNTVELELFDYEDNDHFYEDYGFYSLIDRLYEFDMTVVRFMFVANILKMDIHLPRQWTSIVSINNINQSNQS